MRKFFLTIVFSASLVFGFAQSDFRPGYYISKSERLVKGLIDFSEKTPRTKGCIFKEDFNSPEIILGTDEIKAYRFAGGKFYTVRTIAINDEEAKPVFLEYIVNGMMGLFCYHDLVDHFLVEINGKMIELYNEDEDTNGGGNDKTIKSKKYITELKSAMSGSLQIQSQIDDTKYNRNSLVGLVKKYHEYVGFGKKCTIYANDLPPHKISYGPVIGFGVSKMEIGKDPIYSLLDTDNSSNLSIGFLANYSPFLIKGLSIDFGVNLNRNYYFSYTRINYVYKSDIVYYDMHTRTTMLQPTLGFKYSIGKGKIRPNIAFGGTLNYYVGENSKLIKEYYISGIVNTYEYKVNVLSDILFGEYVRLGCDFKVTDKLAGFANLQVQQASKNKDKKSEKIQSVGLNVGVYF